MRRCVPLEPAADKVCDQASVPPFIFQLPPEEGRKVLEKAQDMPVYRYPANVSFDCVNTGKWGSIPMYFISPKEEKFKNIIFYIHGAGWVFGSFHTHEKLVRELAARTDSAKYPMAIEQCYFILSHIKEVIGVRLSTACDLPLTVAGDSVGGNMAIAMVLMSLMCHGPVIHRLLLYYPVTNACFDTPSYQQFATDYYLYREGMKWFWNQYTDSCEERNDYRLPTSGRLRLSERFSADNDYQRAGGCAAQRRRSFRGKTAVRRRGCNRCADTGHHSRFRDVKCAGPDERLS